MARGQIKHNKKRPLIVICSEGGKKSSEYYYFRNFSSRDLRIQFSTGNSTDPKGMLNDLLNCCFFQMARNIPCTILILRLVTALSFHIIYAYQLPFL